MELTGGDWDWTTGTRVVDKVGLGVRLWAFEHVHKTSWEAWVVLGSSVSEAMPQVQKRNSYCLF